MASVVHSPQNKHYVVKNLGWLLRHAQKSAVQLVVVTPTDDAHPLGEQFLSVTFEDDFIYCTDFASPTVLWDWLHRRRSWKGVGLFWHDRWLDL